MVKSTHLTNPEFVLRPCLTPRPLRLPDRTPCWTSGGHDPLAQPAAAKGLTYSSAEEALKRAYVRAAHDARRSLRGMPPRRLVSRISSTATGIAAERSPVRTETEHRSSGARPSVAGVWGVRPLAVRSQLLPETPASPAAPDLAHHVGILAPAQETLAHVR